MPKLMNYQPTDKLPKIPKPENSKMFYKGPKGSSKKGDIGNFKGGMK